MTHLIKVTYENERPTVMGRDLHNFLEVKTEYKKWFERMSEYGFAENIDFLKVTQKCLPALKKWGIKKAVTSFCD